MCNVEVLRRVHLFYLGPYRHAAVPGHPLLCLRYSFGIPLLPLVLSTEPCAMRLRCPRALELLSGGASYGRKRKALAAGESLGVGWSDSLRQVLGELSEVKISVKSIQITVLTRAYTYF